MEATSAVVKSLADADTERVGLGDLLKRAGSRAHGLALLLFVLPETIPLPTPSLSTILAVPLVLVSAHLALFGEDSRLPGPARRISVKASTIQRIASWVVPALERVEALSKPRLQGLVRHDRLLGVVCLALSIVLALPIPLANFAPAICLAAIAFGMLQRDGALVALGLLGTLGVAYSLYLAGDMIMGLFAGLGGGLVAAGSALVAQPVWVADA
jgi:hypothetical protein